MIPAYPGRRSSNAFPTITARFASTTGFDTKSGPGRRGRAQPRMSSYRPVRRVPGDAFGGDRWTMDGRCTRPQRLEDSGALGDQDHDRTRRMPRPPQSLIARSGNRAPRTAPTPMASASAATIPAVDAEPRAQRVLRRGQRDRREHRLVAQLGEEERDADGRDRPSPSPASAFRSSSSSSESPRSVHAAKPRNAMPADELDQPGRAAPAQRAPMATETSVDEQRRERDRRSRRPTAGSASRTPAP